MKYPFVQSLNKTVILIAGPTAVGKTAVGIAVAKYLQTEIISADSRQCFRELKIGVARPSPEELVQVPHHFIASHSIQQKVTAADFEAYALAKADEIFRRSNTVVMVGGTGLYIKAFIEGLDAIPEVVRFQDNLVQLKEALLVPDDHIAVNAVVLLKINPELQNSHWAWVE